MKEYSIRIVSWEKYNGRKEIKNPSWMRFQLDFFQSPNFYDFTTEERLVWIYILCVASKLHQDTVQVPHQCSHRMLHQCTGIDEKVFHRAVEKLKQIRLVEIRTLRGRYANGKIEHADVMHPCTTEQDRTEQDRTEQDRTCSAGSAVTPAHPNVELRPGQIFIREYVSAYRKRYGENTRPTITGKTAGQVKQLLASIPVDRAIQLIQVYLQMDDKWFETKCHDFGSFMENLTKIGLALDTGQDDPSAKFSIEKILKKAEMKNDIQRI